jgi:hypothetical protein
LSEPDARRLATRIPVHALDVIRTGMAAGKRPADAGVALAEFEEALRRA